MTAILGVGFDPGVVNAYCALAAKRHFDAIDTGLPTQILEVEPGSAASFDGTVRPIEVEVAEALATVTVSASDPMYSVTGPVVTDPGASTS